MAKEVDSCDPGPSTIPAPLADVYPSLAIHSANEKFKADTNKDKSEAQNCSKCYPVVATVLLLTFSNFSNFSENEVIFPMVFN